MNYAGYLGGLGRFLDMALGCFVLAHLLCSVPEDVLGRTPGWSWLGHYGMYEILLKSRSIKVCMHFPKQANIFPQGGGKGVGQVIYMFNL